MIKAIIFDCFGVLVGRGFEETYQLAGGNPVKDSNFIKDTLGQANLGLMSQDEFHAQMSHKLGVSMDHYQQAVAQAEQPNQELLEYIDSLHKNYKTAILSNANAGVLERKISPTVLANTFDALIVSAEVGITKPDSRIYELAAERLALAPANCLFVDDKEHYCEAARAAGMQAILYKSLPQLKTELQKILTDS